MQARNQAAAIQKSKALSKQHLLLSASDLKQQASNQHTSTKQQLNSSSGAHLYSVGSAVATHELSDANLSGKPATMPSLLRFEASHNSWSSSSDSLRSSSCDEADDCATRSSNHCNVYNVSDLSSAQQASGAHFSHLATPQNIISKFYPSSKCLNFVCLYAIVLVCGYICYAAYAFSSASSTSAPATAANSNSSGHSLGSWQPSAELTNAHSNPQSASWLHLQQQHQSKQPHQDSSNNAAKLDVRLSQLEKYIELLAVNLQLTEKRLSEREKCDCPKSCSFNNTRYLDGSSWTQQCDECACKAGRIYCTPIKCPSPPPNCDSRDLVMEPGKCCPVCMKKCKFANKTLRHNETFSPQAAKQLSRERHLLAASGKQISCKCIDGSIKCEAASSGEYPDNKQVASQSPDLSPQTQRRRIAPRNSNANQANFAHGFANPRQFEDVQKHSSR